MAELKRRIISQDIALGRLQFEVDCVMVEYHHEIEGKNKLIQAQNDNPSSEIGSLARATNDKGCRYLIQNKSHEIADLDAHLNNLRAEKWQVEQNERARDREAAFTAATACYSERGLEEFKIRLRTATKERGEAPKKSARV